MSLTEYETTVVIRANIGGDMVEATLDRVRDVIKNKNGKLLAMTHWGKKKLAYEIQKQTRGIYVHTHFLGANDVVAEIERNLRINENVLRFLTIRLADQVGVAERDEQAYVRPEYEAEDAAEEAAEEAAMAGEEGGETGDDSAEGEPSAADNTDAAPERSARRGED